jgi:hypothetical protein
MSYSVFITRKKHWHESDGGTISVSEWRSLVEADAELQWSTELGENVAIWQGCCEGEPEWVTLTGGSLETQLPSPEFLEKLVSIACSFQARVVGEEGETYGEAGAVLPPRAPSVRERLLSLASALKDAIAPTAAPGPGFGVGARVRDFRGRSGAVTSINLRAERGLG